MLTVAALEKAIDELGKQKQVLVEKIQKAARGKEKPRKEHPEERFGLVLPTNEVTKEAERRLPDNVELEYQRWYSACRAIIEKNQPSRLREFDECYLPAKERAQAHIARFLAEQYISKNEQRIMINLIERQFAVLAAVPDHVRSSLYDIELTAYAVLMDDELEASRHLLSKGFFRAAGAVAGVILERHLKILLTKHSPPIKYGNKDTLSKLNDLCKETVYDTPTWRWVQHLIDLRNLCDHVKEREPKKDEVRDLIDGVSRVLKEHSGA